MAYKTRKNKADTKLLLISWGLGIGLIVFYVIYWIMCAQKIESTLVALKSPKFSFSSAKVDGFPYRFTITIKDLDVKIGQVTRLKATEFSASASTFEPQLWVLEGASRPSIWLDDPSYSDTLAFQYEVKPNNFQASLRMDLKPLTIERLSIQFAALETEGRINRPDFSLGPGEVHLVRDNSSGQYAFSIDLKEINNSEIMLMPRRLLLRGLLNNPQNLNRGWEFWAKNGGVAEIKYGTYGRRGDSYFADNMLGILNFNDQGKFSGRVNADIQLSVGPYSFGPIAGAVQLKDSEIDIDATTKELLGNAAFDQYHAVINSDRTF
jgi:hypothetical protein